MYHYCSPNMKNTELRKTNKFRQRSGTRRSHKYMESNELAQDIRHKGIIKVTRIKRGTVAGHEIINNQ